MDKAAEEKQQLELMAAVDAAVTEATPPEVRAATPETPAPETPAPETPAPETPETPAETPAETPPEGETPKPDAAKPEEPPKEAAKVEPEKPTVAAEPPVVEKPPKPAQKPPDFVNDPIPDSVKGRTRERMEGLVSTTKELRTELTHARRDLGEFYQAIHDSGTPPEQFAEVLGALAGFHSSSVKDRRKAGEYFRGLADTVATDLGDTPPGVDPLAAYPDLKQRVEEREITAEIAHELAGARNRKAADERRETREREKSQAAQTKSAAVDRARRDLNALGAAFKTADPLLYEAKNKVVMPVMERLRDSGLDPALFASTYQILYQQAQAAPNGAAATLTKPGRAPLGTGASQPLRPRPAAGGGAVQEPKSALEAIELALSGGKAA